jgi:hypothetical protein
MPKKDNKAGQAAVEFAVFGAILIFLLGTIVRSAVGNSYTQNQNFKAMRMAMLDSWQGSEAGTTSHNSASILFIEDRLAPDFNKYGGLERNPFVANGSGTFTYELLYPLDVGEVALNLPIMDVYINGQHFPFTTAAYYPTITISRTTCPPGGPYPPPAAGGSLTQAQCLQNQCLRNSREWVGGTVTESQFENIIPVTLSPTAGTQMAQNASTIFSEMETAGLIGTETGTDLTAGGSGLTANVTTVISSPSGITPFASAFPGLNQTELNQIQSILQANATQYKLFYAMVANGEDQFNPIPPPCANPNTLTCKDKALTSSLAVPFTTCPAANINAAGLCVNAYGDMEYDLLRNGDYVAVDAQFPEAACSAATLRCNIAWQWSATAATSASQIGLVTTSNTNYPSYDIDGRLKPVTIYTFSQNTDGTPVVSYEDFQGGDIDGTWDINSCGPKPGLQNNSQIYTFTSPNPGTSPTYLQILEGKLFNPETDQFVRSVNKRDNVDLIQRQIQLSNDTHRFCNGGTRLLTVANDGVTPNPVEVCIAQGSTDNCFSTQQNIKSTCFDENDNMLFVRSRLEDRRGNFWMTDTSGQLKVQ